MPKIYITGITGFLGSNIAAFLIGLGYPVIATYRQGSSKDLCLNYLNKIDWVLQNEEETWIDAIINFSPDVIIHAAWIGVGHKERDDWPCQFNNIVFLKKLLLIAQEAKVNKFISLGSQAEYGIFDGCISENQPLNASEAYGCVKIICSEMVRQYCNYHKIDWYWLRLFSFFGKGESENWLIPSLVKNILFSKSMDLTPGCQKYAYLYVNDLALAISNIIEKEGNSGIYNISGSKAITLKSLIEYVRDNTNRSFKLNFGALPYRANQAMHIQGDSSAFIGKFGEFQVSDFEKSLLITIEELKTRFKK